VTPNVSATIAGVHPFDKTSSSDVDYERAEAALLMSFGDKQCLAGLS
jgi:hypothetical protein